MHDFLPEEELPPYRRANWTRYFSRSKQNSVLPLRSRHQMHSFSITVHLPANLPEAGPRFLYEASEFSKITMFKAFINRAHRESPLLCSVQDCVSDQQSNFRMSSSSWSAIGLESSSRFDAKDDRCCHTLYSGHLQSSLFVISESSEVSSKQAFHSRSRVYSKLFRDRCSLSKSYNYVEDT